MADDHRIEMRKAGCAMTEFLTIELLPAGFGDCIWVEYGDATGSHYLLIDGGLVSTSDTLKKQIRDRLRKADGKRDRFELMIVTHVDRDHIGGVLALMRDAEFATCASEVWFNGLHHLERQPNLVLGPAQGEQLTQQIRRNGIPWNTAFDERAVVIPDDGPLPTTTLAGGLTLTLLSPTWSALEALQPTWKQVVDRHGLNADSVEDALRQMDRQPPPSGALGDDRPDIDKLIRRRFESDPSVANESSVACLIEFGGVSCLLAGDAHAETVESSLDRLLAERDLERLPLDALKLSHHGGSRNTSASMLQRVTAKHYLVSTNGVQFSHPSQESIARVITTDRGEPTLCFNYRTEHNRVWDDERLMNKHGYQVRFPPDGTDGFRLRLGAQD